MERIISQPLPARRGNAILVGVIVTMVAATAAVTTAEMAMRRHRNAVASTWQAQAVSAVEAVLARRESLVAERAASGDPAGFAQWDSNYGVDIIGGCEVRWKIEPVRTPVADGSDVPIPFITNPSPDLSWTPPSGLVDANGRTLSWDPNDYIYLYRVGAEARVVSEINESAPREDHLRNKPLARAQGARYVTVNNLPLFRWVIFYAAKGPKGDLELSHGSNLNILGNVHSNGAIYLGSAPNTNMWGALKPTLGFTDIGPYDGAYGNWSLGTTYKIGQRIAQGTDKYRCIAQHLSDASTQPGSGSNWVSVWQLQWRTWTAGQTYAISDRIEHGGERYKCTAPHTAVAGAAAGATEPAVGPAWQSTWEKVLEARVSGVNGVFRLSKQTMLGAINDLPMFGSEPSTFSLPFGAGESYLSTRLTSGNDVVGEPRNEGEPAHYLLPANVNSISGFTYDGVVVNPNRVRDGSGLQTQTADGADDRIAVNGVAIRGVADPSDTTLPSNDSRDVDRAATSKWRTTSRSPAPVGFDQMIRNIETGGKVTILPRSLENRPLEAHRLAYPTASWSTGTEYKATLAVSTDTNVVSYRGLWWRCISNHTAAAANEPGVGGSWRTTWKQLPGEPHDYARPQFIKVDGSSSDVPVTIGTYANGVEVPGQYQRYALGSASVYLARRAGMTGWDAVTRTGTPASQSALVGLTIRERPVPDVALNPNHTSKIASLSSSSALPYAYGKHSRPSLWPFTAADVSGMTHDVLNNTLPPITGSLGTSIKMSKPWVQINESASGQSYGLGGSIDLRAACNPGSNYPAGIYDGSNLIQRKPHFYADNWRFIQLAQAKPNTAATGLTATYYNDLAYEPVNNTVRWPGAFGGAPVHTRIDAGINFTAWADKTWGPVNSGTYDTSCAPGLGRDYWSVRWEGFIVPDTTASYEFIADTCTYGARVWIDGRRVIDAWTDSGTARRHVGSQIALTAGQTYAIQVEHYNAAGTASIQLKWRSTDGAVAEAVVPASVLRPRLNDSAARQLNVADWSTFNAAQFRIGSLAGNALQKLGLMLRAGAGLPLLHNGTDAYAAVCYSPTRGVFVEQRGEPSAFARSTGPTKFVGSGDDAATMTPITSTSGELASEDRNNNGVLDTAASPSEDNNGNGVLDDAATAVRRGKLLPFGPFDTMGAVTYYGKTSGTTAVETRLWEQQTWYKPSTAGIATFGTSIGSGSSDARLTSLTVISNPPFAVPEGTVDKIYKGPLTLNAYKQPRRRVTQGANRLWYWLLDTTTLDNPATQLFLTTGNAINDQYKSIRWYITSGTGRPDALQTSGNRAGTAWTQSQGWDLRTTSPGYGLVPSVPTSLLTNTFGYNWGTSSDSGYQNWGTAGSVVTTAVLGAKDILYVTSPIDTRPKVYQGTTFVRYLTATETQTMMNDAYGAGHAVITTMPGYPVPADVTGNTGWPTITTPVYTQHYPEAGQLAAAVTNVAAGMTLFWNNDLRIGDRVLIDDEQVEITALESTSSRTLTVAMTSVTTTATVSSNTGLVVGDVVRIQDEQVAITGIAGLNLTVSRGQNSTLAAAHAIGAQVVRDRSVSIARAQGGTTAAAHAVNAILRRVQVGTLTSAVTTTTPSPWTLTLHGSVQAGDLLRIDNEIVRVTAATGGSVTVTRGNTHTTIAAHAAAALVYRVIPRTFRLDRQRTYTVDTNSWSSAYGNIHEGIGTAGATSVGWFWDGKAQTRPWNASAWAAITAPLTGGLRPDVWYQTAGNTAPPATGDIGINSLLTNPLPASGRALTTAGTVAAQVVATPSGAAQSSVRWLDDTPASIPVVAPVGSNPVWLRLEKSGSRLRFLYRVGDTGSFTPVLRGDGTVAELEAGRWFTRTATFLSAAATNSATTLTVANTTGIKINDVLVMTSPASSENVRVTAVPSLTQLTVVRGYYSTAVAHPVTTTTVTRLTSPYRGDDLQLGLAIQGGPQYWTTLSAYISSSTVDMTVPSTQGMQIGDVIQIDNEMLQITGWGAAPATQLKVSRSYNGTTAAGHNSGSNVSSVTNSTSNATSAAISQVTIETGNPAPREVIDSTDWEEASGGAAEMTKYLASQYQVLWGVYDITEDFFSYNQDSSDTRLATEEWIYNPREFWSQSRWWEDGAEKDEDAVAAGGNGNGSNHDETLVREWLGKTTLLTLNMRQVQDYLRIRTLGDATNPALGVGTAPVLTATAASAPLLDSFNGLFYLVRTNRYPVNPLPGLFNPWNLLLPNTSSEIANLNLWFSGMFANVLQPYPLARAPSFRSNLFHHGVRIVNGSNIDWGLTGTPAFGTSKTSIVTPNQLFVQGDLNTIPHNVSYEGGTPLKLTPTAIMGDVVTLLSNGWSDSLFRQSGITTAPTLGYTVSAGGTLAMNQGTSGLTLPAAQNTSYYASILTHNQPTTRDSVYLGESSAFINTMQYLEDWSGRNMNFLGSLVVFDSRRYSEAYLLESPKVYGRSPFGYYANGGVNESEWITKYNNLFGLVPALTDSQWEGQIGAVQGPPNRNMDFNYDLLTEAGTPPFTPFGVTASGVGAWTRVIE